MPRYTNPQRNLKATKCLDRKSGISNNRKVPKGWGNKHNVAVSAEGLWLLNFDFKFQQLLKMAIDGAVSET